MHHRDYSEQHGGVYFKICSQTRSHARCSSHTQHTYKTAKQNKRKKYKKTKGNFGKSRIWLLWSHVAWPQLCPWDSLGKNIGVGCHFLLQGNFPTQELNPSLLHCRQMLYQLSYMGSLRYIYYLDWVNSIMDICLCTNTKLYTLNICSSLHINCTLIKLFLKMKISIFRYSWFMSMYDKNHYNIIK